MYQLMAFLLGIALAVMLAVNGGLSAQYGAFTAAAIIHLVGSVFALALCALQKEKKPLWGRAPKWIYLGGAIGVMTTVFQNAAFGHISVTSIVALFLLGQSAASLVIDGFGLFGMAKRPLRGGSVAGLLFALTGVAVMLDGSVKSAVAAVCVALCSGVTAVASRIINARLGEQIGALRGSLVNHLVGLPLSVAVALVASRGAPFSGVTFGGFKPWIYLGGVLGVGVVLLSNLIVPRIAVFRMTLLTFVGQVFAGILLDLALGNGYSDATFSGGIIIAAGVLINILCERAASVKEQKELAYRERIRRFNEEYRKKLGEKYGD